MTSFRGGQELKPTEKLIWDVVHLVLIKILIGDTDKEKVNLKNYELVRKKN